jgi:hypothetical protein
LNMMVLRKAIQVRLALGLWCGVLMDLWYVLALSVTLSFYGSLCLLLRKIFWVRM